MYKKKRRRSSVVEKFRKVSDSVWICLKGMIVEKTIKEESSQKNNFYDNYNQYSDNYFSFEAVITGKTIKEE